MTQPSWAELLPKDEMQRLLAISLQKNPPSFRKFFETAVFITDAHKGLIKVEPWPHLLEMADAWDAGESEVVLKARQIGVSYLMAAYVVYKGQYFPGSTALVFSQGQTESYEIIDRAVDIWTNQPEEWKVPLAQQQKGRLAWQGGGRVLAFSSSAKGGRSFTGDLAILDEAGFHPDAATHYAALRPTISAGGQFLCVSTANGSTGWFYDMYQSAKNGVTPYKPRFVSWDARPDRDEKWLENERRAYPNHPALFRQEYPANDTEAFVSFSGMVFGMTEEGEEIFSRAANVTRPPCRWEEYKWRIVGVDPGGSHPTAIVFLGITEDERLHAHFEWVTKKKEPVGVDQIAAQIWKVCPPDMPAHLVVSDPSNRLLIESLARLGFRSEPASRDKAARIQNMITFFRARRLTISPWCSSLVEQLYQYYWVEGDPRGGGGKNAFQTTTNTDSHHADAIDALGYAVVAGFRGVPWRTSDGPKAREPGMRIAFR